MNDPEAAGDCLFKLQEWLIELYRRQLAYQDEHGVIVIHPSVAQRFALGLVNDRAFVVMPDLEVQWAARMQWSHAAMRAGKPTLYLVSEPLEIDGVETPPFGMSFIVAGAPRASALQRHAELELRNFVQSGEQWGVSPSPFACMPLIIVDEDDNVFEARQKRALRTTAGGRR